MNINTLDAEGLARLALQLGAKIEEERRKLSRFALTSVSGKNYDAPRRGTAVSEGQQGANQHGGSQLKVKTLRVLVRRLVSELNSTTQQVRQARKVAGFKQRSKSGFQVGARKSVRAISGGLPERDRRKF